MEQSLSIATDEIVRSPDDEARQIRLEQLAAEFIDRFRQGERPSIEDYKTRHPDLAEGIEELFPAIVKLEGLKRFEQSSSKRQAVIGLPFVERLGDFRIIREIGRGGMGVVFEAEQLTLHRRVALKVLGANISATEAHFARFRREAESAAKLHHTNIVPIYGTGEDHGVHFYAMQYINGWALSEIIEGLSHSSQGAAASGDRRSDLSNLMVGRLFESTSSDLVHQSGDKRSSEPEAKSDRSDPGRHSVFAGLLNCRLAAKMVADLAGAVAYAHSQGVIHRDIKPSNVLVDRQGVAWLVDFGLAKRHEEDGLTKTGHVVGTVQYMAPEQFSCECHERSDIHSLGLTLYELLALKPAYAATNQVRLMQRKASEPPVPLRSVAPHIPRDLETIVMKACAVSPLHRYQTASAFAEDLRRFVADEPILARRTTPLERLWRWARLRKVTASLTALTLLLVIALLGALALGKYRSDAAYLEMAAGKKLAQDNLEVAVEALDEITANVSARGTPRTLRLETDSGETSMSDIAVSSADAELLGTLLKFYDRFAASNQANLDAKTARTEAQIGEIEVRLGHLDRAESAYEEAIERFARLRRGADKDVSLLLAHVSALNELGTVRARTGDVRGAFSAHSEAISVLEQFPNKLPEVRFAIAQTLSQFATVGRTSGAREMFGALAATGGSMPGPPPPPRMSDRDRPPPRDDRPPPFEMVLQHLNRSWQLLRELVAESPSNPEYRLALARCELDQCEFASFPGMPRNSTAPSSGANAESLLRELVAEFPESPKFRFELAQALTMRSRLPRELEVAEQKQHLVEAIELSKSLSTLDPRNSAYQLLVAQANHELATVLKSQDQFEEACVHFEEARRILRQLTDESPSSAFYPVALSQMLLEWSNWQREQGRVQEAAESLQEALVVAERMAQSWRDHRVFQQFLRQVRRKVAAEGDVGSKPSPTIP